MAAGPRRRALGRWSRSAALLGSAVLAYYTVPLSSAETTEARAWRWILFILGVLGLIALTAHQIRRQLRSRDDTGVRLASIMVVLYAVVVFFSVAYYGLATRAEGQMEGIATRTDALYYTVVTLGTVGYGDVHAVGQGARIVTTVQILFDLVIVGLLASVATQQIQRMGRRSRQGDEQRDERT
ncbi:potassium channel family protein [Cellulomonas chengniuliangii]|uniref:Potassium channel family protein n=1 Tax=Cellulomonas chengniuliangii TaxID=2968084 RepID=A0ABY5L120_9CELL|nr:potassium channel family protein [Cellulomonas chengniuliangii]MCC2307445.1 potassium channel family protein [Cellulomonas chengniuliangii]MCC2318055.1 potassium channel family protein [Cellulomonas chengniuliangii]UUI75778.1 potassium channel family protein [Cellulomonas chengniuliangii]